MLADDPLLTCRLPGLEHRSPQRIVLDSHLRTPPHARIFSADASRLATLIITTEAACANYPQKVAALSDRGAEVVAMEEKEGKPHLPSLLHFLAQRGVTRLMVEAGAAVTTAFISENGADRLYWFRAPMVVGEGGAPAVSTEGGLFAGLVIEERPFGDDRLTVLASNRPPSTAAVL